ncbi:MAG: type II toxin-antitoxin system MqsR family toxin, partial [Gilliamella sp.]|nr:type II toxin-antitoxin system MqsR family toxin [Gilliamella sp.]
AWKYTWRFVMEVAEALARVKFLVKHNHFQMVRRRDKMAMPVSVTLAKEIVKQLSISDFVKHERNRSNPLQFVWVFKTSDGQAYYIKFVFTEDNQKVVFISFHLDY